MLTDHSGPDLFLVDAPLDVVTKTLELYPKTTATLRLKYATNSGGLLLPQLLPRARYSLFDSLKSVLEHRWHFRMLFDGDTRTIPGPPLLYLLSNSVWGTNLRYLTKDIYRISFEDIRNPSLKINNELHARREILAKMKSHLAETIKFLPSLVAQYFDEHPHSLQDATYRSSAIEFTERHKRMLDQAVELDRFLMETFQLLMSSISVRDSQLSIQQSQRATRLTQLAFIYVPLSFVTGIFGMNIQELNATGLSIWVCFVALAIIAALTSGIFWVLHVHGKKKKVEEEGTGV